jgi:hypothetical protein
MERQVVYRSIAVPIGSGRFARDTWTEEPVLEREQVPNRASGHARNSTGKTIKNLPEVKQKTGRPPKYNPEDCRPAMGLFRFVRTEPTPGARGHRVVARCEGAYCGGSQRTFSLIEWCEGERIGCLKCVATMRRLGRKLRSSGEEASV